MFKPTACQARRPGRKNSLPATRIRPSPRTSHAVQSLNSTCGHSCGDSANGSSLACWVGAVACDLRRLGPFMKQGGGGSGAGDGVLDSRQRGVVVEPGRYEAAAGVSPSRQATHNRVRVSC
jgi:hypothetical protein